MSDEKKEKKNFKRPIFHKIVNVFIGFFAILFFLLIVFFGFSQTKTFRGFLKNQITDQVSNSINGNLYIERIDGSIFSSIILNKTVLTSLNDTLIDAEQISIKTSPVHLLLKRILIREISIRDAKINLLQDSEGVWNLS
ncbi:MAG: AsmA family protein, partial [Ignavibacteriae bacterium]|nr:AsmA family protein [Ignavibacteriota bacterium]